MNLMIRASFWELFRLLCPCSLSEVTKDNTTLSQVCRWFGANLLRTLFTHYSCIVLFDCNFRYVFRNMTWISTLYPEVSARTAVIRDLLNLRDGPDLRSAFHAEGRTFGRICNDDCRTNSKYVGLMCWSVASMSLLLIKIDAISAQLFCRTNAISQFSV